MHACVQILRGSGGPEFLSDYIAYDCYLPHPVGLLLHGQSYYRGYKDMVVKVEGAEVVTGGYKEEIKVMVSDEVWGLGRVCVGV